MSNKHSIFALLLVASVTPEAASAQSFEQCVSDNTEFYGTYCFQPDHVASAVISSCRKQTGSLSFMQSSVLTDGDKASLLQNYIETIRDDIVRKTLDYRITQKIDCGQYNNLAQPNDIDRIAKP